MGEPLLQINNLTAHFGARRRSPDVVTDTNIAVNSGEIVGAFGESGPGRSVSSHP
jgi:ABC-type glutathione transport system ATPase component